MLKRVVSLIVGVCCLLTMTGAFAAMTYVGTTTEYVAGDNTKVTVRTTVSGAENDVATYLVYGDTANAADTLSENGSNIVYVDQYKFTGSEVEGQYTFEYQTAATNLGADVKLASSVQGQVSDEELELASVAITVVCNGVTYASVATLPTAENGLHKIAYDEGNSGIISSVKVGETTLTDEQWFTGVDALYIVDTVEVEEGALITITADAATVSASTNALTWFAANTDEEEDLETNAQESILMVGTVTGNVKEFGMILADTEDAARNLTADHSAKLEAFGKNKDGKFAIRAYNSTSFAGTYFAITYYVDANDVTHYAESGLYIDRNASQEASISLEADEDVIVIEDAAMEE